MCSWKAFFLGSVFVHVWLFSVLADVADEIYAELKMMKDRKAEQDQAALQILEAEKADLAGVVPIVARGKSCTMYLPIQFVHVSEEAATNHTNLHHDVWIRKLIQSIWDDVGLSGHVELPKDELAALNKNASHRIGCRPSTFGESVDDYDQIFSDPRFSLGPGDVFVDLGGGVGKAVIFSFLKFNVTRGVSVELSPTRFDRSCIALQRLQGLSKTALCGKGCRARMMGTGQLEMVHANMLDFDLSQATVVTMWAACLSHEVMNDLHRKMLRELKVGARVYDRGEGWVEELVLNGRRMTSLGKVSALGTAYRVEAHPGTLQTTEL